MHQVGPDLAVIRPKVDYQPCHIFEHLRPLPVLLAAVARHDDGCTNLQKKNTFRLGERAWESNGSLSAQMLLEPAAAESACSGE